MIKKTDLSPLERHTVPAETFARIRAELEMTNVQVAEICGVTPRTVSRWATGRQPCHAAFVALLLVCTTHQTTGTLLSKLEAWAL